MANTTTTALLVIDRSNVSKLVNKDLRSNVSKMLTATASTNKNMWVLAVGAYNIIENELYKDDFGTLEKFGVALDCKKSTLSKWANAVRFIYSNLKAYGYDMEKISYSNAYLLSSLGNDFEAFMKQYEKADAEEGEIRTTVDFGKMAKSQLEKLISDFKNKDVVEAESKAEDGKKEEKVKASVSEGCIIFTYNEVTYKVPLDKLSKYAVKNEKK